MNAIQQKLALKSGTRALVVGLGATGLSCARYLNAQGLQLAITDSREQPPNLEAVRTELPDAALFLGGFDENVFTKADLLVVSPGVPLSTPEIQQAIAAGIPVVGDVELFAMATEAPVAAITGSNGKSTVTTLLGQMAKRAGLKVAVGGNLGDPVLDLLQPDVELYVLELSSFQLETTESLRPAVATVLNISADHMDRYRDLDHYADTKAGLLVSAQHAVVNRDDPKVMAMPVTGERMSFSLQEIDEDSCFNLRQFDEVAWLCQGKQKLISAAELKLAGQHNLANALAALAMGNALKLPLEAMLDALRNFRGLPHRTEYLGEKEQVRWYNDSKGTNPGATIAALKGLQHGDNKVVLIAGGDCKHADFAELGDVIGQTARVLVSIGVDAEQIERMVPDSVPVIRAKDMEQAVALAAEQAVAGDCVLLSPACASFDMFRDYQHRGEVFTKLVGRWLQ